MKQPFSYYGGKQRIASKIIPYIPRHTVYVELFCGGASLFWQKPDLRTNCKSDYREVLNDTNSLIYNFFVVLRDRGPELKHMIDHSLYSEEEFKKSKEYKGDDELLKAYYWYININQSFGSIQHGGWGRATYCRHHPDSNYIRSLSFQDFVDRLRKTYIANTDALKCLKDWDSPHTFFYCDPPYPNTDQGDYSGYTQEDFENLLQELDKLQGSFILSCYPNDVVPKDWEKVEFKVSCSVSNMKKGGHREKRTECIWIREARVKPRQEILNIYDKQNQLNFKFG